LNDSYFVACIDAGGVASDKPHPELSKKPEKA
jgi:hypothetical protein